MYIHVVYSQYVTSQVGKINTCTCMCLSGDITFTSPPHCCVCKLITTLDYEFNCWYNVTVIH